MDFELAIDPATYVMTKGIRHETADIGRARLTLAATKRLRNGLRLSALPLFNSDKECQKPVAASYGTQVAGSQRSSSTAFEESYVPVTTNTSIRLAARIGMS